MQRLVRLWLRYVNPHIATLVAAIGVVGLTCCLLLLLIVGWLCQEVWQKESFSFDTQILLWIYQSSSPLLDRLMLGFTELGNPHFVVAVVVATLFWLCWRRQWLQAKMFALACLGATVLNQGLKLVFVKPRPTLWTQLITETSFSFPSGHALGTLVLYGFLAYLLVNKYPKFRLIIYAIAGLIIAVIGLSRLYLGVHWPTDIIAGYAIGFLWLFTCLTLLKLQVGNRQTP